MNNQMQPCTNCKQAVTINAIQCPTCLQHRVQQPYYAHNTIPMMGPVFQHSYHSPYIHNPYHSPYMHNPYNRGIFIPSLFTPPIIIAPTIIPSYQVQCPVMVNGVCTHEVTVTEHTTPGILLAIFCFPCGILCCLNMTDTRCYHCQKILPS